MRKYFLISLIFNCFFVAVFFTVLASFATRVDLSLVFLPLSFCNNGRKNPSIHALTCLPPFLVKIPLTKDIDSKDPSEGVKNTSQSLVFVYIVSSSFSLAEYNL